MAVFSSNYDSLERFLADAALTEGFKGERNVGTKYPSPNMGVQDEILDKDNDSLVLSTIHQAKGLEWNTVFVIGLVDGQFPHHKVFDKPAEMEEERRLFYVATTRAQENLYLTYPVMNHSHITANHFNHPSTFIEELPEGVYEVRRLTPALGEIDIDDGILDKILAQKNLSDDEPRYIEE